jgi:hypothetical protein
MAWRCVVTFKFRLERRDYHGYQHCTFPGMMLKVPGLRRSALWLIFFMVRLARGVNAGFRNELLKT